MYHYFTCLSCSRARLAHLKTTETTRRPEQRPRDDRKASGARSRFALCFCCCLSGKGGEPTRSKVEQESSTQPLQQLIWLLAEISSATTTCACEFPISRRFYCCCYSKPSGFLFRTLWTYTIEKATSKSILTLSTLNQQTARRDLFACQFVCLLVCISLSLSLSTDSA